ncbi:hypothetical protein [Halosimplex sp. TS25]|uniref:hypothetical protein n=1 Tax=Halosimplex rarum TaxID=3396619 RepID=UPI0039EB9557
MLFFDVPKRESDAMPWLCDKPELAKKWADYGQGEIVDAYPLVYRDDLDDLAPEFQDDEGFVDWYRFGEHGRDEDWIRERTRVHDLIEFDDETEEMESTAGAYLGKYLSTTFGSLLDSTESLEERNQEEQEPLGDKATTWKLALYWATDRRFWSCSKPITIGIDISEYEHKAFIQDTVRSFSIDSIAMACDSQFENEFLPSCWDTHEEQFFAINSTLQRINSVIFETIFSENPPFRTVIEYLGAYSYWDLPS